MVQWLRLHTSIAKSAGLIPGRGTKIPHTVRYDPKKMVGYFSINKYLSELSGMWHQSRQRELASDNKGDWGIKLVSPQLRKYDDVSHKASFIVLRNQRWCKEMKRCTTSWFEMYYFLTINIVKMTILPKEITDTMQCLSNFQWHFSQN